MYFPRFDERPSSSLTHIADSSSTEDDEEHGSCTVQAEADAATLSKEIAGLDEDISVWEGDKKASTEVGCAFSAAQSQYPGD